MKALQRRLVETERDHKVAYDSVLRFNHKRLAQMCRAKSMVFKLIGWIPQYRQITTQRPLSIYDELVLEEHIGG